LLTGAINSLHILGNHDTQEAIRIKAVVAVVSGKSQVEVAEIFGITRQALGK